MSEYSELYETFITGNVEGVDIRTIQKLSSLGIDTISQLKETGWKRIAQISNIGEKKLVPIFAKAGISLTPEEVISFREDLKKFKVSPTSSEPSTSITPVTYTVEDLKAMESQVGPIPSIIESAISSGKSVTTTSGKSITLTSEQQRFKKMTPTTDLENFIKAIAKSPSTTYTKILSSVLNSTETLVPTGARSHVKQWITLLSAKMEGKKVNYDFSKTAPKDYQSMLKPLIEHTIEESKKELPYISEVVIPKIASNSFHTGLENITNTVILYKIYIDSTGSGWDLDSSTGQLGTTFDDGAEFIRRMAKRLSIDLTKESPHSDIMMRIKRVWSSFQSGNAVLLAGSPGSGKTYFSKAVGESMTDDIWSTLPFSRVNITGGIEPSDLLGEWDYQAQILALETARIKVGSVKSLSPEEIEALRENIYTTDFFRFGPVSMSMIQGTPILIDEVNRGSPDIQNTLLQAIDENEVIVPGIGRIKATPGFFVIATINEQDIGTTDLGAAFLRRVVYINFEEPSDYTVWVKQEYPSINEKLLSDMEKVRKAIKSSTSITSEIPPSSISAWAKELINLYGPSVVLNKDRIIMTLGTLLKNKSDIDEVKKNISTILSAAGLTK